MLKKTKPAPEHEAAAESRGLLWLVIRPVAARVLLISFAVIIGVSALIHFAIIPATKKLSETKKEVAALTEKRRDYENIVESLPAYAENARIATSRMNSVKSNFGTKMDSEQLDKYISGLLVENGIAVTTFSMTPAAPDQTPPYTPDDSATAQSPGENTDAEAASLISSYTVTVKATGTLDNLFSLMDSVAQTPGIDLVSYVWKSVDTVPGSSAEQQTISLVFKVYVV